jgi:hypothetical protein
MTTLSCRHVPFFCILGFGEDNNIISFVCIEDVNLWLLLPVLGRSMTIIRVLSDSCITVRPMEGDVFPILPVPIKIGLLRKAVKADNPNALKDVDAAQLKVYQFTRSVTHDIPLPDTAGPLVADSLVPMSSTRLSPLMVVVPPVPIEDDKETRGERWVRANEFAKSIMPNPEDIPDSGGMQFM